MRKGLRGRLLGLIGAMAVVGLSGCGSPVTDTRLAAAVNDSFAHRYVLQQQLLDLPARSLEQLAARTVCARASGPGRGAGVDWGCSVQWAAGPGPALDVRYEVEVKADGCYTTQGPPAVLGPAVLHRVDGATVANPLLGFEGCFDLR